MKNSLSSKFQMFRSLQKFENFKSWTQKPFDVFSNYKKFSYKNAAVIYFVKNYIFASADR